MRVVMLGPPGAGKGTQAARIGEVYGIPHVATGDIFRANVSEGTELGRKAEEHMEAGELVPDDIVIGMVTDRLERPDVESGFVLDGFPRTVPQAQALEEELLDRGTNLDVVLRLTVGSDEILQRLTERRVCRAEGHTYHLTHDPPEQEGVCDVDGSELYQREDDERDVVLHRLEVYHKQTEPLEIYYWERGLLRELEAVGTMDEVTERALGILGEYAAPPDGAMAATTDGDGSGDTG